MSKIRFLIVSTSCFEEINRSVYKFLATAYNIDIHLVIPKKKLIGFKYKECSLSTDGSYRITAVDSRGKYLRFQRFLGLEKIVRDMNPDFVLIESDPASLLVLDIIMIVGSRHTKIWAFTNENMERDFISEGLQALFGGRMVQGLSKFLAFAISKKTASNLSRVFVMSQDGLKAMTKMGFEGRVVKIPLGFDPAFFYPYSNEKTEEIRKGLGLQEKTIAYFGRLSPEKGIDLLLKALCMIKDLKWQFLIDRFDDYNSGYGNQLLEQIRISGISDRTVYFNASHNQMPDYINASDIVVLPSVSGKKFKEQYGRVLTEAMACRKIVVGSTCGAIPEIIGGAGFVFEEGNASALAERLRMLLTAEESHIQSFRNKAYDRARNELSIIQQAGVLARELSIEH